MIEIDEFHQFRLVKFHLIQFDTAIYFSKRPPVENTHVLSCLKSLEAARLVLVIAGSRR